MYALKNPKPVQPPVRSPQEHQRRRSVQRAKVRQHQAPYRAIAYETAAKLTVNVVLSTVAITALVQLLPYRASQSGKMQELEATLQSTGDRVKTVQDRFQHFFDPYQARENMQELTDRIDPNRRRIIWKTPSPTIPTTAPTAQPAPSPTNGTPGQ